MLKDGCLVRMIQHTRDERVGDYEQILISLILMMMQMLDN